jgi:hypothetical protein
MAKFFSTLLSFRLLYNFRLILIFFLLALLATAGVQHVPAGESARIVAFGVVVLALSLSFPRFLGPVDKESADFIYYFAGIAVAALVFFEKGVERQRIETTIKLDALVEPLRAANSEIGVFDYVRDNEKQVLQWVNDRVDAIASSYRAGPRRGLRLHAGIEPL